VSDAADGHALWTIPHITSEHPLSPRWASSAEELLVWDGLGTEVFDAATGARLARLPATGAVTSLVRPDLRTKLVISESNWDFRPLPQPTDESPTECLARTLERTGLALEGVEIVAAP